MQRQSHFPRATRCKELPHWLLDSILYAVTEKNATPVVRRESYCLFFDLLEDCKPELADNALVEQTLRLILQIIVKAVTDIWSAVRKACIRRLQRTIGRFQLPAVHQLADELYSICLTPEPESTTRVKGANASTNIWRRKEGALRCLAMITKAFKPASQSQAADVADPDALHVVNSASLGAADDTDGCTGFLFGTQRVSELPSFLCAHVRPTVYSLLAHVQLSVREEAT